MSTNKYWKEFGFSSNVWMWELDYKESWVPKNWCFWTVMLEKTLRVPWTARRSNQSVQLLSHVRLWHARLPCPSPSPGVCSNSVSIELMMPSSHLVLYCPLLFLLSIFSSIRVFSNESTLQIRWPKYWSSSFSLSPSSEYSGLISFRIDWFDLLAVQGTLKSLLQHHSSKASILWWLAFFMVHPLHPYMTTFPFCHKEH